MGPRTNTQWTQNIPLELPIREHGWSWFLYFVRQTNTWHFRRTCFMKYCIMCKLILGFNLCFSSALPTECIHAQRLHLQNRRLHFQQDSGVHRQNKKDWCEFIEAWMCLHGREWVNSTLIWSFPSDALSFFLCSYLKLYLVAGSLCLYSGHQQTCIVPVFNGCLLFSFSIDFLLTDEVFCPLTAVDSWQQLLELFGCKV